MRMVIEVKVFTENDKNTIIDLLNKDEIVAIKTDTVFGIMARMSYENEKEINLLKKSDSNKKISIIVENKDFLFNYVENLNVEKRKLIDEKLPGKYTFIVNLNKEFCKNKGFNRTDFGVRVTTNDFLQEIISKTGPLLASSCNITGLEPCSNTEEIVNQFKDSKLYVVAGNVTDNTPSTIISLIDEIKIIRK